MTTEERHMVETKITVIYDNPPDPEAFEVGGQRSDDH